MENSTAIENTPYTLPECTITAPEGMRFVSWAIGSPDGERKAVGESVLLTETTSLYAIWETIPHEHCFDTAFETDDNNHWKECSCGEKSENAAHIDGNGDNKCDACDYAMPKAEENDPSAPTPDVPNTNTDKPTDATDKPTDATESEKDDSTETEKKNGCGSTLALSSLAIVAVVGSALVIKKKED